MKKNYISPKTEVVFVNMSQPMLAGSPFAIDKTITVDDYNILEAPGMNDDVKEFFMKI